jgi:23S rRNA pseudouridine1911/1915/1917 synthase
MTSDSITTVTVPAEAGGGRLDRVLAGQIPDLSRSRLKALILAGQVTIGGRTVCDPAVQVNSGERIADQRMANMG